MGYGLAHLDSRPQASSGETVAEPVAVTTLDALIPALQLTRVDFIEADIEGYEAALIAARGPR